MPGGRPRAGQVGGCPAAPCAQVGYCRGVVDAAWIVSLSSAPVAAAVDGLRVRLAACGVRDVGEPSSAAELGAADLVVVWADRPLEPGLATALAEPSVRVLLAGPSLAEADPDGILAEAAGIDLGPSSPPHDVRVRMGRDGQRLYSAFHVHGDHAHHDEHEHLLGRVAGRASGSPTTCACCARHAWGSPTTRS